MVKYNFSKYDWGGKMNEWKIALLGAGNMGGAILHGIIGAALCKNDSITVFDKTADKCAAYTALGCNNASSAADAVKASDAVIIAVKPQQIDGLFDEIAPVCGGKLFVSIAAGVTIARIEAALPNSSVVRVMPNTPLMVGEGVSALCRGTSVSDAQMKLAMSFFSVAGYAIETTEDLLNPMTSLTSSSVAYFARFIDDMCKWAKDNGFSGFDDAAICEMVSRTAIGTGKLLIDKKMSPAALVKAVASPNGTTERALAVFDDTNFDGTVTDAMDACRRRADELSGK